MDRKTGREQQAAETDNEDKAQFYHLHFTQPAVSHIESISDAACGLAPELV